MAYVLIQSDEDGGFSFGAHPAWIMNPSQYQLKKNQWFVSREDLPAFMEEKFEMLQWNCKELIQALDILSGMNQEEAMAYMEKAFAPPSLDDDILK